MRSTIFLTAALAVACSGDDDKNDDSPTTETGETTPTAETGDPTPTAETGDTGTQTTPPVAEADNDNIDAPLFTESFLGSGAPREHTFEDAISAAPGDPEDWIGFTTPAPQNPTVNVTFAMTCTGTDTIGLELWDTNPASPVNLGASFTMNCATSPESYLLDTSNDFAARIYYPSGATSPDYTDWALTISW